MHFLVFGKTGQVARELARLDLDATFLSRQDADLADPEACGAIVRSTKPDAVINAAAWTNVDAAEANYQEAEIINGIAPTEIARSCADLGIPMVQISSDYVFDGSGNSAFEPNDKPNPLGGYGKSKLIGEKGVRKAGGPFAILRTSWVFSAHGQNFVKTMLRLSENRDHLNVGPKAPCFPSSFRSQRSFRDGPWQTFRGCRPRRGRGTDRRPCLSNGPLPS